MPVDTIRMPPQISRLLGIEDKGVARALDKAVGNHGSIDVQESNAIIASVGDGVGMTAREWQDLNKIARDGKDLFQQAASWAEREQFDALVAQALQTSGPMTVEQGQQLGAAIATISDPVSLAHAARAVEKMRANQEIMAVVKPAFDAVYYDKLIAMSRTSQPWSGKQVFDQAFAQMLGLPNDGPQGIPPTQLMAHALRSLTDVAGIAHALRSIEKLRANGMSSKTVDDALYAVLQKLDGPAETGSKAYQVFANRLAEIDHLLPKLDTTRQTYNGMTMMAGAVDALLVSGTAAAPEGTPAGTFNVQLSDPRRSFSVDVQPGDTAEVVAGKLVAAARAVGLDAHVEGKERFGRTVIRLTKQIWRVAPADTQ